PTWAGQGLGAAVLVAALAVARVPLTAFPRPPRWFAIALGIGAAIALASGGSPGFDVGGLSFGLGSLFEWLRFTVLGLLVFSLAIVVGWTTPMADLGPAISRLLTPLRWVRLPVDELVATISLCVRSLPLLIDEMRVLYAVRRLRQQTVPTTVREQVTALV